MVRVSSADRCALSSTFIFLDNCSRCGGGEEDVALTRLDTSLAVVM